MEGRPGDGVGELVKSALGGEFKDSGKWEEG